MVARDNLNFLDDNAYSVFGKDFDGFLDIVNRNQRMLYPQADGPITFPKALTEKDRALLAHGLVSAIGPDAKVTDYFEVPGYRLKQFDESGRPMREVVQSSLETAGIFKGARLRVTTLNVALGRALS